MISRRVKILGVSGSLRVGSYNSAILASLGPHVAARMEYEIFDLSCVPLYNEDLDNDDAPSGVQALRRAIEAADGLIVATPEFNHGVPGVLKNALDWASRPRGRAALLMKPILTLTSSPGYTGGVRAQAQLHETLLSIPSQIVIHPQIVIGMVKGKVRDGCLVDQPALDFILSGIDALLAEIERRHPSVSHR